LDVEGERSCCGEGFEEEMDFAGDIQRHEVGVAACDFREGALFWVREVALALRNLHAWFTFLQCVLFRSCFSENHPDARKNESGP